MDYWVASLRAHGDTPATVEHWWYLVTQFAIFIRMNPEDLQTQDILDWLTMGGGFNQRDQIWRQLPEILLWMAVQGWRHTGQSDGWRSRSQTTMQVAEARPAGGC